MRHGIASGGGLLLRLLECDAAWITGMEGRIGTRAGQTWSYIALGRVAGPDFGKPTEEALWPVSPV